MMAAIAGGFPAESSEASSPARHGNVRRTPQTAIQPPASPSAMSYGSSRQLAPAEARPLVLTAELGGRGIIYSANLDYSVAKPLSLGIGISHISISDFSLTALPVYANLYPVGQSHRLLVTVGATLGILHMAGRAPQDRTDSFDFFESSSSEARTGFGILPVFGAGYEYRSMSGFVFRAVPYLFIGGTGELQATGGLSFGAAL